SDWVMLGGMAGGQNEGTPDPRIFMVRTADLEVFDNWDVSGLCGTGSKDSAADNVFVPDYLTVGAQDIQSCATPGSAINPNPIFNLPQAGLFPHIIASPIIGMTEGATDDFIETNAAATSTYNTSRIASYQAIQTKVAGARAATAAARTMIRANCDEATDTLTAGNICGEEQKHRWRRDGAYVANLCFDALQDLYKATGGRGAYKTNSIQRHYRDASVGISHISMSWDVMGAEFGRYALGLGGNPSL
ncbi:MAG: hypothetical protein HQ503_05115, partial [Rhodospirillales bacterium]|nr:hypothetical protein [Rhodospirillales bacterium]